MNPEAQRIAIAEACGWTPGYADVEAWDAAAGRYAPTRTLLFYRGKNTRLPEHLPDYLSDLNAMHEAEGHLNWDEQSSADLFRYRMALVKICGLDRDLTFHATAAQRAEAFLRTLNLWKDES